MKLIALVVFTFSILSPSVAFAQKAAVFSGGDSVKILKDKLKWQGGRTFESTSVDPTAVATPADQGSLLINDIGLYFKLDNGMTTNWLPLNPTGLPLLQKGSILTSDGVQNGEFTACPDGQSLVASSGATSGFICQAVSGAGFVYVQQYESSEEILLTIANSVPAPNVSVNDADPLDITLNSAGSSALFNCNIFYRLSPVTSANYTACYADNVFFEDDSQANVDTGYVTSTGDTIEYNETSLSNALWENTSTHPVFQEPSDDVNCTLQKGVRLRSHAAFTITDSNNDGQIRLRMDYSVRSRFYNNTGNGANTAFSGNFQINCLIHEY